MVQKHGWKMKLACVLAGGSLCASGGGCIPDNFLMTQLDLTLTTAVDSVVGNTIVSAIDAAFGA